MKNCAIFAAMKSRFIRNLWPRKPLDENRQTVDGSADDPRDVTKEEAYARALEVVTDVKLPDPERILKSYPHSRGSAAADRDCDGVDVKTCAVDFDEPTTALDVTVEAALSTWSKIWVKYDIHVVHFAQLGLGFGTCDRICVMYSGEAVKQGRWMCLTNAPPYTQALFVHTIAGCRQNARPLVAILAISLPHERPNGCNFGPRCDY